MSEGTSKTNMPVVTLTEEQAAWLRKVRRINDIHDEGYAGIAAPSAARVFVRWEEADTPFDRGYWLTDAGRAALAAYEATPAESAPAWTPKVGERVRVNLPGSDLDDHEGVVEDAKTTYDVVMDARGYVGVYTFDADELAPVDAPAVERAVAADGKTPIVRNTYVAGNYGDLRGVISARPSYGKVRIERTEGFGHIDLDLAAAREYVAILQRAIASAESEDEAR